MLEAEVRPRPVTVYNYQHRQAAGLIAQLQAEGHDPYCFQSVLINGKSPAFDTVQMALTQTREGSCSLQATTA